MARMLATLDAIAQIFDLPEGITLKSVTTEGNLAVLELVGTYESVNGPVDFDRGIVVNGIYQSHLAVLDAEGDEVVVKCIGFDIAQDDEG